MSNLWGPPLTKAIEMTETEWYFHLDGDIIDILEENNHFITITAISKNGGLHLSLIIFKIKNNK